MSYTKRIFKNNKFNYKKYRNLKEIIEKRFNILIVLLVIVIIVLILNLFYLQIIQNEYYVSQVETLNQNTVEGSTAPRGRIYDRNGILIVNNKAIKVIYYNKTSGITTAKEIELAYKVADILEMDISNVSESILKTFWLKNNSDIAISRITDEEWTALDERKITSEDIEDLKLERITDEDLSLYTDLDIEAAYIYSLMNEGYYSAEKIIKEEDISDEEFAIMSESIGDLTGFNTRVDWERVYPYGNVFKTILGTVSTSESGLPYELKEYYLNKGYSLNDRVGLSYLEYQYEDYLRGTANVYEINDAGEQILVEEGTRGNDIVLTIDIELQKKVEEILVAELIKAKEEDNTDYYNRSFVIITDPDTGEILVMAGKQIIVDGDDYLIYDYTPGIMTSPVVMGSAVKGASQIVGYNTGVTEIGEKRYDTCVKIKDTALKCSWTSLGLTDDIQALKYSSNTYQYYTAIEVGKGTYSYNKALSIDISAFDTYRNTFAEFGLGVKTGIDLPVESLGYKGTSTLPGYLLDFAIGQYDTYTPIQMAQYIGVIANGGYRMQPYLLKAVYEPTDEPLTTIVYSNEPTILNKVNTKAEYLERIKLGFKAVLSSGGTGYGYISSKYNPAGKTGTSQSFVDSDGDGVIDTETITNTFVGYAPYDNPVVTFTVISPDIYYDSGKSTYQSKVNKRITQQVSQKFFEIYQ
ncbi:MAG: penicillin-binding protein 2 [Bacilli bacterium]|nr:penicillin-binding protein 2 [Bacilli bacterium]